MLFGDQTLYCRAADFRRVGGYDNKLPIMEDADLCLRMHMLGPEPLLAEIDSAQASRQVAPQLGRVAGLLRAGI